MCCAGEAEFLKGAGVGRRGLFEEEQKKSTDKWPGQLCARPLKGLRAARTAGDSHTLLFLRRMARPQTKAWHLGVQGGSPAAGEGLGPDGGQD